MRATTSLFIDKYHPKADGKCAISVRVTFERKKKYYRTPISLTVIDYNKTQGEGPRGNYKIIALKLQGFEKKAADVIQSLPVFTWQSFEKLYLSNRGVKETLQGAFSQYIEELRQQGRIGTAVSYECAKSSLSKFSEDVRFAEVTPDFLYKYEHWMLRAGNSVTTVGIYLRSVRTLFNNAIAEGLITKDYYPFGKKRYEIPTANNVKKALTLNDISKIYYFSSNAASTTAIAKDYWLFMYLCNGINVKDMCLLKWDNIKGDVIEFERAKTARTKRKIEPIRVTLSDELKTIIRKRANKKKAENGFIFPVLSEGLTVERQRQLVQQLTKLINTHMKYVADKLEINAEVTTYAARHSFATILQRSGVSTEFISEALGHTSVKTTQNYLAGFEDETKKEVSKVLTAFKVPEIATLN